jgi:hypothetical protein
MRDVSSAKLNKADKLLDPNRAMEQLGATAHIQSLVKSYKAAPALSDERRQILSSFSQSFTLRGLNKFAFSFIPDPSFPEISQFLKQQADEHAEVLGPGRLDTSRLKQYHNQVDEDEVGFCLQVVALKFHTSCHFFRCCYHTSIIWRTVLVHVNWMAVIH